MARFRSSSSRTATLATGSFWSPDREPRKQRLVVVAIDHPESTYDDQQTFASTLYNRPFDQLFILNEMARLAEKGSGSFRPDSLIPRELVSSDIRWADTGCSTSSAADTARRA